MMQTIVVDDKSLERYKKLGTPTRRHLAQGERIPVPGYEFLRVVVEGEALELMEFKSGEKCLLLPNAEGLARAVFSLVVLNQGISFTHQHLRYIRRHLGYTQEKLADRLCVQRQTIVRYERSEEAFDKVVELAVRLIALPTALNYLPANYRRMLSEPLSKIQDLYSHLDELIIPVDEIRAAMFKVSLPRESEDQLSGCR